jgi:murein DD-endopeptidase MepM/ murein hydrolase activator NlpD
MKLTRLGLLTFAVSVSWMVFGQDAHELRIRFAPDHHVFLAQDNRFIGLSNFEIQNIAVINPNSETVKIDEIVVEIFTENSLIKSTRFSGDFLEKSWRMLRSYIDQPGNIKTEDPRFRFKELLGDQVALAQTTTLPSNSAILISRQFFFVQAVAELVDGKLWKPIWPNRVRVSAKGTSSKGAIFTGQNELRMINYQPKNQYQFPVHGRWYIAASSSVRSHHRLLPVHEFALDVIQIGADGKSYKGEGTNHSDYYAYGKPVYAMADGEVVEVYDGVSETRLRRKDESQEEYRKTVLEPLGQSENPYVKTGGNQIIIRHKEEEYSSYAHLKFGSIAVKKGDRVKQGQLIANVGLSGDGFQPHLHFQITDGPDVSYARGIPMIFQNVTPVLFSSTIDFDGHRQLQTGEFIETAD